MTPSRVAPRKPRAPKRVCAATATLSSARSRCGRHDFRRLGAVDHPRDAEAIGAHAEALGPESLLDRHRDGAVLGEQRENTLGLIRLLHGRHHVEALGSLVAIAGASQPSRYWLPISSRAWMIWLRTSGGVCPRAGDSPKVIANTILPPSVRA